MTHSFDRPPAGLTSSGTERLIGLDVARAISLIGVVVMNYCGMAINDGWSTLPASPGWLDRVFDVRTGVLSTRFAAAFVVVAGGGLSLLTQSARRDARPVAIREARQRLLRRGAVLFVGGYFLDWAWPGTILFYYGVYFVLASFVFQVRTRVLVVLAAATCSGSVAVSLWRRERFLDGDPTEWVSPSAIESLQDLLARAFLGYTHPVLPWFAFFLVGMLAGRHLDRLRTNFRTVMIVLAAAIAVSYGAATALGGMDLDASVVAYALSSMHPSENGAAYIVSTISIALAAVIAISAAAEMGRSRLVVTALQRAGQLSLTLYLGHVLFYYSVVRWIGFDVGTGLGSAIRLALCYWVLAIASAAWWHHRVGPGPAERIYRWLGG